MTDNIVHVSSESSDSSSALECIKESVENAFINKSNCKFCQCDFRGDAESLWLQSNSISGVHRFLRSKEVSISYAAVRNHLLSHFQKEVSKIQVAEYLNDLSEWRKSQLDKENRLELMLSVLEKRIFELSSMPKDSDEQFRKNSEIICKMMQQAISVQDSLDKHKGAVEPVTIFIKRLQEVIELQIEGSNSKETRNALVQVVSTLEKNIGDLLSHG
ncbi:hypothetical protein CMI47_02585 [Candidatus Pacearchaeota archaeon]|jgi:hypothetical protein|nr:hypothetical protein [Candidatus Pacearchaeota archaeon]|tara:strand:- start:131 stop:778 length:648 start_codon:yes stop_codon:yes gene_type:complete